MEYIFIKDPHFMFGFRNNIRKPGWEKDIDYKITQIIEYCKSNNINIIIFSGDVFEKSKKSDWNFNQVIANKSRLKQFKANNIEVYSIMGNHDYFDGHENIENTFFGDCVETHLINYIDFNKPFETNEAIFYGIDYHEDHNIIQEKINIAESCSKNKHLNIIIHANVTKEVTPFTDFTFEELAKYNVDCFLCGHYHIGSEIDTINNTTFFNPWNLTRVSRDYNVKSELHIPQFIHAKIKDKKLEYKVIDLKFKSFKDAFNSELMDVLSTNFKFFNNIDIDEFQINDDDDMLTKIADKNKISKESLNIAKDLLQ